MSLLLYLLLSAPAAAAPAAAPDTVVVCPPALMPALQPWITHRQAQGHRLVFLAPTGSADEIRQGIVRIARTAPLRTVVLVGDVDTGGAAEPAGWHTPAHHLPAEIVVRWGSAPEIATDNPYGDLDGDGVPDLAVGRLSAQSPEQLQAIVAKILEYERADHGAWRRRINVIAGVGGFSPLADMVVESATRKLLTDGIPDGFDTTMTYASWQSPFCPDPRRFRDVALQRLNEGCLFWVYLGHGHRQQLDYVRVPGSVHPILQLPDLQYLSAEGGLPIALLLACHTGAFDQPQDCLAESMLRQPGGPVAVLSGSRVTMPYAMAVFSNALMDQVFRHQAPTLGEIFRGAKQQMVRPGEATPHRQLLDALAAAVSPAPDQLAEERQEHLALFNLLGDPLLRIGYPAAVTLDAPESLAAGEELRIRGGSDLAGEAIVEVVARRDRMKHDLPQRNRFEASDEFLRSLQADYFRANDRVWARQAFSTPGGPFELQLRLPAEARGPCYVRVWIQAPASAAQGATRLFIHPPAATE